MNDEKRIFGRRPDRAAMLKRIERDRMHGDIRPVLIEQRSVETDRMYWVRGWMFRGHTLRYHCPAIETRFYRTKSDETILWIKWGVRNWVDDVEPRAEEQER